MGQGKRDCCTISFSRETSLLSRYEQEVRRRDVLKLYFIFACCGNVEYYSIHRAPFSLLSLGFNVETVPLNSRVKASVTIWDAGGHSKMSHLFRHYYAGCRGIIFVIPSFWGEDGHNNCFWREYKIDKKPKVVNMPEHVNCI